MTQQTLKKTSSNLNFNDVPFEVLNKSPTKKVRAKLEQQTFQANGEKSLSKSVSVSLVRQTEKTPDIADFVGKS